MTTGFDDRARTPADVPVAEMERLLVAAPWRGAATSPTSTSSTSAPRRCCSRRASSAPPPRASPAAWACAWWPASAPATPTPTTSRGRPWRRAAETAAHIASDSRDRCRRSRSRPRPSTGATRTPPSTVLDLPRPHRAGGAGRPRRPRLRPAHREGHRHPGRRDQARPHRQLRGRAGGGRAAALLHPRVRDRAPRTACAARAAPAAAAAWARSSSTTKPPEYFAREAARMAITLLGAAEAPAGPMPVVLAPGLAGHPAARGGGPRPGGRLQPQGHLRLLRPHRPARGRAGRDRGGRRLHPRPPRQPQRGRRGQRARPHRAHRGRHPARLPAGPAEQRPHEDAGHRQRPAAELRLHPHAAHDQHLHAGRPGRPRGHHPLGAARPLRQALRRRAGGHHERQVRVLGHRGLPDRGRPASDAPVVGATLIGNGPDVLTKVTRIGHDLQLDEGVGVCCKAGQNVPVGVGLPTILVSEITVGGTRT